MTDTETLIAVLARKLESIIETAKLASANAILLSQQLDTLQAHTAREEPEPNQIADDIRAIVKTFPALEDQIREIHDSFMALIKPESGVVN